MKITLRPGILTAFAIFIVLTLGASRIAHVFSGRALLEEELSYARNDLEGVAANLGKTIAAGKETEGLLFIDQSYRLETIGSWDCCYVLCDKAGTVISPFAFAGKPLEYSVYQQRADGITLGTFSGHKVAVMRCEVSNSPYTLIGLYEKDYLLGDSHYMEGSYRIILLGIIALLLLVAWIWVIPAVERIVARRRSAEQALALARNIQQKAVTQEFPLDDRVDSFAILRPMYDVGGDIYGCRMVGNKLCFVIGDVSGKGIEASFMMFIVLVVGLVLACLSGCAVPAVAVGAAVCIGAGLSLGSVGLSVWSIELTSLELRVKSIKNCQVAYSLGGFAMNAIPGPLKELTGTYVTSYAIMLALVVATAFIILGMYRRVSARGQ